MKEYRSAKFICIKKWQCDFESYRGKKIVVFHTYFSTFLRSLTAGFLAWIYSFLGIPPPQYTCQNSFFKPLLK